MSQSFDLSGVTHVQLNGLDCPKLMLNGVRIWERYTATRQVWVSSGYSSSSWVYRGSGYEHVKKVSGQRIWSVHTWGFSFYVINHSTTYFRDGWKFTAGAFYYRGRNDYEYYKVNAYESVTSWVDTSGYQTENYTAYYY